MLAAIWPSRALSESPFFNTLASLELARIGSLFFIFADSPNDQIGSSSPIDTYATRLSAQPLSDVHLRHSYEEVARIVSGEVAATLDPSAHYGISWYGKQRHTPARYALRMARRLTRGSKRACACLGKSGSACRSPTRSSPGNGCSRRGTPLKSTRRFRTAAGASGSSPGACFAAQRAEGRWLPTSSRPARRATTAAVRGTAWGHTPARKERTFGQKRPRRLC